MDKPFLLAPMASLSHRPLRELIEYFSGCDEYYSEMISAPGLLDGGPLEKFYIDAGPRPDKVVYQLVGGDEERLVKAASLLDQCECAGLDINMGCSAPEIIRSGGGAAWMAREQEAIAMISSVRAVCSHRLSVKLRLGWTDDYDALLSFCRKLEAEGIERITLHPRTVKEKFKRKARWEVTGRLYDDLNIPVAGNGDIASAPDLVWRSEGPCAALMAGRAAVKMPWLFAEARALQDKTNSRIKSIDLLETALEFLSLLERYQPPQFFESRAKKFFAYFCDNVHWAHYLKTQLGREKERSGFTRTLKNYFAEHVEERFCRIQSKESRLSGSDLQLFSDV